MALLQVSIMRAHWLRGEPQLAPLSSMPGALFQVLTQHNRHAPLHHCTTRFLRGPLPVDNARARRSLQRALKRASMEAERAGLPLNGRLLLVPQSNGSTLVSSRPGHSSKVLDEHFKQIVLMGTEICPAHLQLQGSQPYFGPPRDSKSTGAASPTNSESESV